MEKIGLLSVLNDRMFNIAMKMYMNSLEEMERKTSEFANMSAEEISKHSDELIDMFGGLEEQARQSGNEFSKLDFKSILLANTLAQVLYSAISKVVQGLKNLVVGGIMAASRVQELDYVLQILGKRAGFTKDQIDEQVDSIVNYGIRTDVAQNLVQQFIRYQLDLSKATDLARVAQDTAIIAMEDSSMTLDRMIYGIQRYDIEIMRTIGLNIDAQQAFANYAAEIGKSTKELNANEKQQAFLNAVLVEGARNAGLYEAAMESAGKQLRSTPRYIYELTRVMGEPFLNAFGNVVKMLNDTIKAFTKAADEGGPFHDTLMELGAAAALVTEQIAVFVKKIVDMIIKFGETIPSIDDLSQSILNMNAPLFSVSALLVGFIGYMVVVKKVVDAATKSYAIMRLVMIALKAATLAIFSPTMLLIGALGLLAIALITNFGGIRDKIVSAINDAGKAIKNFIDSIGKWIANAINSAYNWGVNLINQFATGIVNAANNVLNSVMQWIGNIIASWLSPGSPPKIAPDLVKWGIAAINEWLKGFTQADWSILEGIQAPLKSALDYLAEIGKLSQEEAGQAFADLSKQLIKAMDTGEGIGEIIDKIKAASGDFGTQVAELAQNYFQLENALSRVAKAEEMLVRARKKEFDAGQKVNKSILEYNRMLRSGATQEELDAKLKEINAAKEAQKVAKDEVKTAEKRVIKAREQADVIAQQIAQQQKLINMLLELARAQIKTAEVPEEEREEERAGGGAGGGAAGGGLEMPDVGAGGAGLPSIEDTLKTSLDNLKEDLKKKLLKLWEDIKKKWTEGWQNIRDKLVSGWERLKAGWSLFWEALKKKVSTKWNEIKATISKKWEAIKKWFSDTWEGVKKGWSDFWGRVAAVVGEKWQQIKDAVQTKWNEITTAIRTKVEAVRFWIQTKLDEIKRKWDMTWTMVKVKVQTIVESIRSWIVEKIEAIKLWWNNLWDSIRQKINDVWLGIQTFLANLVATIFEKMGIDLEEFKATWAQIWDDVKWIVREVWRRIKVWIQTKVEEIRTNIEEKIQAVKDWWDETWTAIKDKVEEIWESIRSWVEEKVQAIKDKVEEKVQALRDWWDTTWTEIKTAVETKWNEIKTAVETKVQEVYTAVETKILALKTWWDEKWLEIKTAVETKWTEIKTAVETKVQEVYTAVETKVLELKSWWETTWGEIKSKVETIWSELKTAVETKVQEVYDTVTGKIEEIWTNVSNWVTTAYNAGVDIIQGMIDGVLAKIGGLISAITGGIAGAISSARTELEEKSPSKVFIRMGVNTMKGLAKGIMDSVSLPKAAMQQAVMTTASPISALPNITNYYNTPTVSMGDINLNNGMDMAGFDYVINRALRNSLRR